MQDGTGTTLTTFDSLGRETSVRYGSGHTLSYAYDANDNRTQMTDPDTGVTTYLNDASGRLTRLTNPQGETTSFAYDALDRLVQKTLANGVVETHVFDDAGRETKIVYGNAAGTALASFASAYDATDKRTQVTEADGSMMSYSYDADGQLLSETRTGTNAYSITYTYDALGNRLTKSENGLVTSYSYNAANQLLGQQVRDASGNVISQSSASYDLNGNVTQQIEGGQTTSFSWNSQDYLVGVTHPDGTSESYTYCGEGIRRTKTDSQGLRRFIRDGHNVLIEVADTGGTLRRYTHQSDEWGTLLSLRQGQTSRFYGFDGSANTRLLTDENASVSDGYLYSAFGQERQVTGTSFNPLRFGGQVGYHRDEAKRLYVRARHLDVSCGRWLSRDPIGFDGGDWNLHRYAGGDAVNEVDPYGLAPGDSWDPRTIPYLIPELNPFNRSGSLRNTYDSMYEGGAAMLHGDTARGARAYDYGVLGQTRNSDPVTRYGTRGALVIAGVAAGAAAMCIAGPTIAAGGRAAVGAAGRGAAAAGRVGKAVYSNKYGRGAVDGAAGALGKDLTDIRRGRKGWRDVASDVGIGAAAGAANAGKSWGWRVGTGAASGFAKDYLDDRFKKRGR